MRMKLIKFIERLREVGRYSFSRMEFLEAYSGSKSGASQSLARMVKKKRIISLRKGFYVIIPPEYNASGILPPILFLDDLMQFLGNKYYLGLLNAAAMHGASHQLPQTYQILTTIPKRMINVAGVKIEFFIKSIDWCILDLEKRKTDTGYIWISSPELTAIDLVTYEKSGGGLNNVVTVLYELSDRMDPEKLKKQATITSNISSIQRLGYLLEKIVSKKQLVLPLKKWLKKQRTFRIPLKSDLSMTGATTDSDWKIAVNTKLEGDL